MLIVVVVKVIVMIGVCRQHRMMEEWQVTCYKNDMNFLELTCENINPIKM